MAEDMSEKDAPLTPRRPSVTFKSGSSHMSELVAHWLPDDDVANLF
jgi:hypothetical protein